jgi:hypothetical protein
MTRTEILTDIDRQILKDRYKGKDFWTFLLWILLIGILLAFIAPYLPPLRSGSYNPPTNSTEYVERVKMGIVFAVLVGLWVIGWFVRATIDLRLGYKSVSDHTIKRVVNLLSRKILVLDQSKLFVVHRDGPFFKKVTTGQKIQIIRTGTKKLFHYYVTD